MEKDKIAMKYKGNGFYVGVPARDLTAVEVERYGKEFLLGLGLYDEVITFKPKLKTKVEKPPEAEATDTWHEEDELWQE